MEWENIMKSIPYMILTSPSGTGFAGIARDLVRLPTLGCDVLTEHVISLQK
jgi:hypothetical protein